MDGTAEGRVAGAAGVCVGLVRVVLWCTIQYSTVQGGM